jgi:mRNA export factor
VLVNSELRRPKSSLTADTQNGQFLFSGGCDNAVQMYDMNTGQNSQVAAHDAPVKCVRYSEMPNGQGGTGVLITAGWDKKVKVRAIHAVVD